MDAEASIPVGTILPIGAEPTPARGHGLFHRLASSLAAQIWTAVALVVFVPVYIRYLGVEAYGLVGFNLTLQTALQVLDMGLSPTMNREMARYAARPAQAAEARDFVRTLEAGYWLIGIVLGLAVVAAAPWLASRWFHAATIPTPVISRAIVSMGLLAALQWPLSLYQGGLIGLQRQTALNLLLIGAATLRYAGAAAVVAFYSPTIDAFFRWQILAAAAQVVAITWIFWRSLPAAGRSPHFDPRLLKGVARFAAGMSGIGVLALLLTQLDKLVLSRLLSLRLFGYYTLATVAGSALSFLSIPVVNTIAPVFTTLVTTRRDAELRSFYRYSTQLMALVMMPAGITAAMFAPDVFYVWTGSRETAAAAATIARLLILGTALHGMWSVAYYLQLAFGWTRFALRLTALLLALMLPALFVVAPRYGGVGAAALWLAVNLVHVLVAAPVMHRYLLPGEVPRWFRTLVTTAGVAIAAAVGMRLLLPPEMSRLESAMGVGVTWLLAFGLVFLFATPLVRHSVRERLAAWRAHAQPLARVDR